jgi:hypothetical protein
MPLHEILPLHFVQGQNDNIALGLGLEFYLR